MQPSRCGVGPTSKFATSVQLCENYFNPGKSGLWFNINRDTTTVISNSDASILIELNSDVFAVSSQRLVNAVIDDFPEAVHESAAIG